MIEVLLAIWIVTAVAAAIIANSKGRSGCGWLILSALFGPLALLAVAMTSRDAATVARTEERAGLQAGTLRRCPTCNEAIRREAAKCKHCGADVEPLPKQMGLFGNRTKKQ